MLALALLCAIESVFAPDTLDVRFVVALSGLVVLFGCGQAGLLTVFLRWLPAIRPFGRLLPPLAALLAALWLADNLGVFVRLNGPYRHLAIATGVTCLVGGWVMAAVLFGLQATQAGEPGRLYRMVRLWRGAFALSLFFSGLVATVADHLLYVGLYPHAHWALRIAASVLIALALTLVVNSPRLGRATPIALVIGLGLPVVALADSANNALQAFALRTVASSLLETAKAVLDLDGDGFSPLLGGGDCNDRDRHINPTAAEIPNNGIDDNCFAGDATNAIEPTMTQAFNPPKTPSPLNVVLITVDTLRWDRLGANDPAYGPAGLDTMPELTRWSAAGVNFSRAYSGGSWTSISLATLLRGRYARRLRWVAHYETNHFRMLRKLQRDKLLPKERITKMFPLAWRDLHPPLSQYLSRRSMRTAAVVDDSFTLMLARSVGTATGFQTYYEVNPGASLKTGRGDDQTAKMAIQELNRLRNIDRPYFLWVHFFGPHGPNLLHPSVRKDDDSERGRYDHEVRYLDQQLARVLDALQEDLDRTAIFITSDHGEEFGSNYRNHGMDLRENLIRVPLVARVPDWPAQRFDQPVTLIDLMPTILALTDTPAPSDLDGVDLGPWVTAQRPVKPRVLLVDDWAYDRAGQPYLDLVGAFDGQHKLVLNRRNHSFSRFVQAGMTEHPSEQHDLLSGPIMSTLMSYVESAGGSLQLQD